MVTPEPSIKVPRSLKNVQIALQNMLPNKKVCEADQKTQLLKQQYYESKILSEKISSLQQYINSAGFKTLSNTD